MSGGLNSGLVGRLGGVHTITKINPITSPTVPTPGSNAAAALAAAGSAGPTIAIPAPVPPSLSLGTATGILSAASGGDPSAGAYVATTVASANSGHPLGIANAEMLTLAQRLSILSRFTTQFVSAKAGQEVLTGLHLAR